MIVKINSKTAAALNRAAAVFAVGALTLSLTKGRGALFGIPRLGFGVPAA